MLQRTTLLLLVGAVALGGGVLLLESRQDSLTANSAVDTSNELDDAKEQIFPFAEEDVESFKVERPAGAIAFSQSNDTWQMDEPQMGPAEAGAVAFLLSQLTDQSARKLSVEAAKLEDFGLADPTVQVELMANGQPYQLLIGGAAFTGDRLYVQAIDIQTKAAPAEDTQTANSPSTAVDIYLVPGGLANAVNRPTAEWIAQSESSPPSAPD
ncbi:MAG: DUF4340 domain-containing protein [Phormidesmis sp.]